MAGYFKHLTDFVDPNNSYAFDFSRLSGPAVPRRSRRRRSATGGHDRPCRAPANTGRGESDGRRGDAVAAVQGDHAMRSTASASSPAAPTARARSNTAATRPADHAAGPVEMGRLAARSITRSTASRRARQLSLSLDVPRRSRRPVGQPDLSSGRSRKAFSTRRSAMNSSRARSRACRSCAQAKNLTDRPFITYQNNDPRQVIDYQRYGRDYYLGTDLQVLIRSRSVSSGPSSLARRRPFCLHASLGHRSSR